MRIAAKYSDEFNLTSSTPATAREKFAQLDATCVAAGRAPESLARSAMTGAMIGRTEAEYLEKISSFMSRIGAAGDPEEYLAPRRARWLVGTPDQALAQMRAFRDTGASRLMVQHMDPTETASLDLLAELHAQL
jgi:alkanesulfonate monooxygenase SsuD/methylene tetrahydromethanopterin reductase-like flavin-dependent oxidoreductase (luciferase family)